ncbi:DUF2000 domain-containing protein [Streptomyces sp. NPDC049954]|uniref:DUF2000 domain-containing protein n=1 Tax=Streptomyces sp. NPDC049954 TaxID=3155779 RepID=UPI00342B1FC2
MDTQNDAGTMTGAVTGTVAGPPRVADGTPHGDVRTDLSTRQAPSKWVIVVDRDLPAGRQVNAAACMAAAVGRALPHLIGPDAVDASGETHPGLPWAGCSVLAAEAGTLAALRAKAAARPDVLVVDMPEAAQRARVYDTYREQVAQEESSALGYCAISLVGARNRVDRLVGRLPLL